MRVYNRPMSGGRWNTLEEYLDAQTVLWYGAGVNSYSDYSLLVGHWWSSRNSPPTGEMVYMDWSGTIVGKLFGNLREPEYFSENPDLPPPVYQVQMVLNPICAGLCFGGGLCLAAIGAIVGGCMAGCRGASDYIGCVAQCVVNSTPAWLVGLCLGLLIACLICLLWPALPRLLPRIGSKLNEWCPGFMEILFRCMREAGRDVTKLFGCIGEECLKARKRIILPSQTTRVY